MYNAIEKVSIQNNISPSLTTIDLRSEPMKRLKKSYERFLYMAAKYPLKDENGFLPHTYAIDLIWHSHLQEPLNYVSDCVRLVGYIIFHDPSPILEDDFSDGAYQIWKNEFQCDIETDHLYSTSDNKNDGFD
ncbi:unnamed protein product [Rotaria sordida]|uniref:Uncharacterized protein n=1 Tax=Rotaria sordida TaxID=392033 RepID=A0A819Z958_9BILA|nr:unnamed protein product [Rotaria sordida]